MIKIKSEKAFTLVEILISLTIIMLFMSGAIFYNGTTKGQMALFREEGSVISEIYKARSLAVATFALSGDDIPCGYGIHVVPPDKIIIFKEMPSGLNQSCTVFGTRGYYNGGNDSNQITLTGVSLSSNFEDILFVPPDPTVYSNIDLSGGPAVLTLSNSQAGDLTININKFGQISVDQSQ